MRFVIDDLERVYEALVVAVDAARESPETGEIGPWDDRELRENGIIEVTGNDVFTTLVADRWIAADLGFEVI
jgi:hypothetical protein